MNTQKAYRETRAYLRLVQLGGGGMLTADDLPDLDAQRGRVFELMVDGNWHSGPKILKVANGTEGLRRLRELRKIPGVTIECRRRLDPMNLDPDAKPPRVFEYRMVIDSNRGRPW